MERNFPDRVHIWDCQTIVKTPEESFTHINGKRKNNYSLSKVVLKKHDGIIDVISVNPNEGYAVEGKILDKSASKRKWGNDNSSQETINKLNFLIAII